jgi:hypothetical protein
MEKLKPIHPSEVLLEGFILNFFNIPCLHFLRYNQTFSGKKICQH